MKGSGHGKFSPLMHWISLWGNSMARMLDGAGGKARCTQMQIAH
jgi:hypothetical protein